MKKEKCANCYHFNRGRWISLKTEEFAGEQCGGYCDILLKILKTDNSSLVFTESIYVQDAFGCILWQRRMKEIEE